jgi:hypothetical protein
METHVIRLPRRWLLLTSVLLASCGPEMMEGTLEEEGLGQQSFALTPQDNINRLASQPGNFGTDLQSKIMQRAEGIAPHSRPYQFDGVHDCYGYVRQVWNAILFDGGVHTEDFYPNAYNASRWHNVDGGMRTGDAPNAEWVPITDVNQLVPGDILATDQGHAWGSSWHGGLYAGKVGTSHYQWDSSNLNGLSGAYKRPYWTGFTHYYKPAHDLLTKPVGGTTASAARLSDGRLEVFMRARDGQIYRTSQTAANGSWSTWSVLSGAVSGNPVVATQADGRLVMAARASNNETWVRTRATTGTWGSWASLGGVTFDDPALERNSDGRLQVFVRGDNGGLYSKYQAATNGTFTSGWDSFAGTTVFGPVVSRNQDGRLELFARWNNGMAAHKWQLAPSGSWSGWGTDMGGYIQSKPVVAYHPTEGRMYQFVRGTDGTLFYMNQTAANGGWTGWVQLGTLVSTSQPAVGINTNGSILLFVRGPDGAIYSNRLSGGAWSGWSSHGGVSTTDPSVIQYADGRIGVIVRGDNGLMHLRLQTAAGASTWTSWAVLGDTVARF